MWHQQHNHNFILKLQSPVSCGLRTWFLTRHKSSARPRRGSSGLAQGLSTGSHGLVGLVDDGLHGPGDGGVLHICCRRKSVRLDWPRFRCGALSEFYYSPFSKYVHEGWVNLYRILFCNEYIIVEPYELCKLSDLRDCKQNKKGIRSEICCTYSNWLWF